MSPPTWGSGWKGKWACSRARPGQGVLELVQPPGCANGQSQGHERQNGHREPFHEVHVCLLPPLMAEPLRGTQLGKLVSGRPGIGRVGDSQLSHLPTAIGPKFLVTY